MTAPAALLKNWNRQAKKQFGQNFLVHAGVAEKIVARAGLAPDDRVLEIGPGLGALTVPAARRVARLLAVDKDPEMLEILGHELAQAGIANVELRRADILEVDLAGLAAEVGGPLVVLGNLPYNISTPVILRLLAAHRAVARAVIMLQKEVARRLAAAPGGRDYGRLSVMVQYRARVATLLDVGAAQFHPRPKVDSRVVELVFREQPEWPCRDEALLARVVQAAFQQRRKMLKNALEKSALGLPAQRLGAALEAAGIDPRRRAESVPVEGYVALANALGPAPAVAPGGPASVSGSGQTN
jgi:16S rRNA (adenine1518-N6/adenine1519-N6)-dimethyltransferase